MHSLVWPGPLLVVVACLPSERTTVQTPDGAVVALDCELTRLTASTGEGCTFVPGTWPTSSADQRLLVGEAAPLGCKARVPLRRDGTITDLTCEGRWWRGRWIYGWHGPSIGPGEVSEETVLRP